MNPNETGRIEVMDDSKLASQRDVLRVDRDVRVSSSVGFILSTLVVVGLAILGYANITKQISDYAKDRDTDRNEIANLKAQLAGVSAQLTLMATDLKIANAVNVVRASDQWSAAMMAEYSSQLKDAFKNTQGMDWAEWPVIRNIQGSLRGGP